MQIPDSIRIGSIDYEVVKSPQALLYGGQQCYGLCDFENSQIMIDMEMTSKQRLEQTFLHEICHAMLYSRSLKEATNDENLVDELAWALHQLIKDNPQLFLDEVTEEAEEREKDDAVTD